MSGVCISIVSRCVDGGSAAWWDSRVYGECVCVRRVSEGGGVGIVIFFVRAIRILVRGREGGTRRRNVEECGEFCSLKNSQV